jgi:hypothetical protein
MNRSLPGWPLDVEPCGCSNVVIDRLSAPRECRFARVDGQQIIDDRG